MRHCNRLPTRLRATSRRAHWPAVAALLGAVLSSAPGWATDPKASRAYEDALVRHERRDLPGAIIQLKNALQADRTMLPAHVLLGKALLAHGEPGPAEVALLEALRLGVNRAEVVVPLAEAVIRQGRPEAVLEDARFGVAGLPRAIALELLLWHAAAATDLGDFQRALQLAASARALEPQNPAGLRADVPVRIRMRQPREALAAADRAVALAPDDAESHFVRGEALHVVPDLRQALAAYDRALVLEPTHVGALVARAGVHLDFNRTEAASRDVSEALKKAPHEVRALYLRAEIARREGRAADAQAAYHEVTARIDTIPAQYLRYRPQLQMLGGMAHHALGQREKARPYLEGATRGQPGHPVAKVLADVHLAERNTNAAILVLDGYLRANPNDGQARLLLANAHLDSGRAARAVQILKDALQGGDQPQYRAALGLALVGAGRYAEAIKELEAAIAKDPRQLQAGYALGALYVQSRQPANALRVAQSLDKAHPRDARVQHLVGQAKLLNGDIAGARAAYAGALRLDPVLDPARVSLARLEMDQGQPEQASQALQAVLSRNDRHPEALAAMAELSERDGRLEQAERWLTRIDELAGPQQFGPALTLAEFHLRHGQMAKAQEALQRAQARAPQAVPTLALAGRVALAAGDLATARMALARAATAAGYNVPQLTQIAALQLLAQVPQAAAHSLDKALTERPDHLPALVLRAGADIRLGELGAAELRIRRIQALAPRGGQGWALAGDLATARRQPEAALAAYRRAHELDQSTNSLMQLFLATAPRDGAGAIRLAERWLATHPRDAMVWRALADSQFNAGQLAAARRSYESLLAIHPRDADATNNLAHVLMRQNDPAALKTAEQALALAPHAAHVIGTAGWAAFKAGQSERAIQLLRDARLRDPDNADTRYYLAQVLAATGRAAEARRELDAALAPGSGLRHVAEARQLLDTLR